MEDAVLERAQQGGRPVIVQPGLLYGGENRLIDIFYTTPGKEAGIIPYIGDGANRWPLVHIDDIAELYVAALKAKAGTVYVGVGGANPTAKDCALAIAHSVGLDGKVASITLEQARKQMGPIADAFALDQQFTPARAEAELGWTPAHTDPLTLLAGG